MKSYRATKSAGSTFHRQNHVVIDTRDGVAPAVCFHEEEVIVAGGRQVVVTQGPKAFRVDFQPEKVINIVDKAGKPLGRSCTHDDFLLILNSLYLQEATERDVRDTRQVQEAEAQAAALTAAAEAAATAAGEATPQVAAESALAAVQASPAADAAPANPD